MTWWDLANCRNVDPDVMFPGTGRDAAAPAKAICAACPVIDDCLRHAYVNDEIHGVWGGRTEEERRRERTRYLTAHGLNPPRRRRLPPEHGTRGRYQAGCRCTPCRTANTTYVRRRRTA